MKGQLTLRRITNYDGSGITHNWVPETESVTSIMQRRQRNFSNAQNDLLIFRFNSRTGCGLLRDGFYLPHWALATVLAVLAAVSWGKPAKRFSLRAMLIGITFVALVLGLIAVAMRHQ